MNSTELLNEIKNQLELLKHKGYDKNSFKSGYLLGYGKALQLQQTGVMRSCSHNCTTNYCNSDGSYSHKMCDDCGDVIWD